MNLTESVEFVAEMCTGTLLANGFCPPSLFIVGDKKMAAVTLASFGETSQDREAQLYMLGQSISELNKDDTEIGLLESVVFVSEAYLLQTTDKEKAKTVIPSQDPNHIEVLIITGQAPRSNEHHTVVYEMLRDDNGDLRDVVKYDVPAKEVPEHSILNAFAMGYYTKSSGVN